MAFIHPDLLWFLFFIPFILLLDWRRRRLAQRSLKVAGNPDSIAKLISPQRTQYATNSMTRNLLVLTLIIVALARPVWGLAEETQIAEDIAVIVALDISRSMDAQDIAPSRLERAKMAAQMILDASEGRQIGLILFAGDAFVQMPLTSDTDTATTFLAAATSGSTTRQGTALGEAIALANVMMNTQIASQTVLILLSDGESHSGNPLERAAEAHRDGIIIHAIGFGTEAGASIPEVAEDGTISQAKADAAGNMIVTRLERDILVQVSEQSGGIYRTASVSGLEIIDVIREIDALEAEERALRTRVRRIERFSLFLLLALALLSYEIAYPLFRNRMESWT